jgi:hypothetical protein
MEKKELIQAKAAAPVPITSYLTGWDTSDIFEEEKKYRMEEDESFKELLKAGELTEEQLEKDIWNDQSYWDDQYECLCEHLTEVLQDLNRKGCYFKATVKNFGWRDLNGCKVFKAENGRQLLHEILPNCDCTFKFFRVAHGKKLAMTAAHHDSPMLFKEWYIITPVAERTYNTFKGV